MNRLESDGLPPELNELGERLTAERPVASDHALDRVMSRAQSERQPRKSLLWRSTAPRARRKSLALAIAGVMATGGIGGLAVAGAGAVDSNPEPPAVYKPCKSGVFHELLPGVFAGVKVNGLFNGGKVVAKVKIGNLVGVCIVIGGDHLVDAHVNALDLKLRVRLP